MSVAATWRNETPPWHEWEEGQHGPLPEKSLFIRDEVISAYQSQPFGSSLSFKLTSFNTAPAVGRGLQVAINRNYGYCKAPFLCERDEMRFTVNKHSGENLPKGTAFGIFYNRYNLKIGFFVLFCFKITLFFSVCKWYAKHE